MDAERTVQATIDENMSGAEEDIYGDDSNSDNDHKWGDKEANDRQALQIMQRLHAAAMLLLFKNSPMTSLEGNIFVLNIARANRHSNVSILQIFAALHRVLLPKPNTLADSKHEATQQLKGLGLHYETIDVCRNNYVLF